MFAQFTVKGLKEHPVSDFANIHTSVVQDCNDASVLLLHEVHNDLVVEVINLQDRQESDAQETGSQQANHTGVPFHFTNSRNTSVSTGQTVVRLSTTVSTHMDRRFPPNGFILVL